MLGGEEMTELIIKDTSPNICIRKSFNNKTYQIWIDMIENTPQCTLYQELYLTASRGGAATQTILSTIGEYGTDVEIDALLIKIVPQIDKMLAGNYEIFEEWSNERSVSKFIYNHK